MSRMSESEAYKLAKELFSYDPETGIITRIAAPVKSNGSRDNRGVGKPTGSLSSQGYLQTCIFRKRFSNHRLAWLLQTGAWPKQEIDHINGVKTDNRWCNLRDVSRIENMANRHKKWGKNKGLPIGITEQVHKGGYRYFLVTHARNHVCRASTRSTLDEAIELLQAFRDELRSLSATTADYQNNQQVSN